MSTITVKELAAPTGFDLKIAAGETLDLKSQGTVTMPTGSVLQVVSMETTALNATSSTSYVDSTITLAITPSATSSKVLVMYEVNGIAKDVTDAKVQILLTRNSTGLKAISDVLADGITEDRSHQAGFDLDSPSTTSATTYKIQYKRVSGSGNVNINKVSSTAQTTSSITLMEIAG